MTTRFNHGVAMKLMTIKNNKYIVVGCRPWNKEIFEEVISHYPGDWHFLSTPVELTLEAIEQINPRFLFFLHWSWKVPESIVQRYECVGFHPTDLPFGRGGTPVQNLIIRGLKDTKLSVFRMTEEMDGGPIYCKEPFSLDGSAEQIYLRMNKIAAQMVHKIIVEEIAPVPQEGEVVLFKRRKPIESEIPRLSSLQELYDFIRMLDATDYPRAFFYYNGLRYELSEASFLGDEIQAKVTIRPVR